MPPWPCTNNEDLQNLTSIELMLISQILPCMLIVVKSKGAQFELKEQCVLVLANLKKIQTTLPQNWDKECLVLLALKRPFTDRATES